MSIHNFNSFNESVNNLSIDEIKDIIDDIVGLMDCRTADQKHIVVKWSDVNFDNNEKETSRYNIPYFICQFEYLNSYYNSYDRMKSHADRNGLTFIVVYKLRKLSSWIVFFKKSDYRKINLKFLCDKFNKEKYHIIGGPYSKLADNNDYKVLYDDDEISGIRPLTHKGAVRFASDTSWDVAGVGNKSWFDKHFSHGSFYGGYDWYNSKKTVTMVTNLWRRILRMKPKEKEIEVKEFVKDFPRYLVYYVIFKNMSIDNKMSKLCLIFDPSRDEYGETDAKTWGDDFFNGRWSREMMDSMHNNLIVLDRNNNRITMKEIFYEHRFVFNKAFRSIESDYNSEKEKMNDITGIIGDIGGQYKDDALYFVRNTRDELLVTRMKDFDPKDNKIYPLAKYQNLNYDKLTPKNGDRKLPKFGNFNDYRKSISGNVKKLMDGLDNDDPDFGTLGGDLSKYKV